MIKELFLPTKMVKNTVKLNESVINGEYLFEENNSTQGNFGVVRKEFDYLDKDFFRCATQLLRFSLNTNVYVDAVYKSGRTVQYNVTEKNGYIYSEFYTAIPEMENKDDKIDKYCLYAVLMRKMFDDTELFSNGRLRVILRKSTNCIEVFDEDKCELVYGLGDNIDDNDLQRSDYCFQLYLNNDEIKELNLDTDDISQIRFNLRYEVAVQLRNNFEKTYKIIADLMINNDTIGSYCMSSDYVYQYVSNYEECINDFINYLGDRVNTDNVLNFLTLLLLSNCNKYSNILKEKYDKISNTDKESYPMWLASEALKHLTTNDKYAALLAERIINL